MVDSFESGSDDVEVIRLIPEDGDNSTDEEQLSVTEIITMVTRSGGRAASSVIFKFSGFFVSVDLSKAITSALFLFVSRGC